MRRFENCLLVLATATMFATPAQSTGVTFSAAVANLCVLTLTVPGTLGMNSSGAVMSSDDTGGLAATMTVSATGTNPTIAFAAPQLLGPAASVAGATKEIQYASAGGASQAYTTAASSYVMSRLIDTVTIKGRVTNAAGFVTGAYTLSSTATCQQ